MQQPPQLVLYRHALHVLISYATTVLAGGWHQLMNIKHSLQCAADHNDTREAWVLLDFLAHAELTVEQMWQSKIGQVVKLFMNVSSLAHIQGINTLAQSNAMSTDAFDGFVTCLCTMWAELPCFCTQHESAHTSCL